MRASKPHKTATELHTYFFMVRSGMLCRYNVYSEDTDLGELRGKVWDLGMTSEAMEPTKVESSQSLIEMQALRPPTPECGSEQTLRGFGG